MSITVNIGMAASLTLHVPVQARFKRYVPGLTPLRRARVKGAAYMYVGIPNRLHTVQYLQVYNTGWPFDAHLFDEHLMISEAMRDARSMTYRGYI